MKVSSPVIGVILMVAVTVALVALVTVTVFDIGGDVSESSDATVQLEDTSRSVTVTVLRNENVRDFTLRAERDTGLTDTRTLSSSPGSIATVTDSVLATSEEEYGSNHGNGVAGPIQNGQTINLNNNNFESFNSVEGDTTSDSNINYDTGDIQPNWSVENQPTGTVRYTGSTDLENVKIDYDYQTSTDPLTKVSVIANMPDGSSEVLTSTKVQ